MLLLPKIEKRNCKNSLSQIKKKLRNIIWNWCEAKCFWESSLKLYMRKVSWLWKAGHILGHGPSDNVVSAFIHIDLIRMAYQCWKKNPENGEKINQINQIHKLRSLFHLFFKEGTKEVLYIEEDLINSYWVLIISSFPGHQLYLMF